MAAEQWKQFIQSFDDRRDIIIPGDAQATLAFCANQFAALASEAIATRKMFNVALSGGSTPKALYELLASPACRNQIDWKAIQLFWSDERSVPPDDPESNYAMAMKALTSLPIPKENIFRMEAESKDIDEAAVRYEATIEKHVPQGIFDLIMLGMGEDGHTASLFPKTHGLHASGRQVIANFIPQKQTWRMTFTYQLINSARHIDIYVIGKSKATMLKEVLTSQFNPDVLPIQNIGTRTHKALWIVDKAAAAELTLN